MLLLDYWKNIPGFDRYQASYSGFIRHLGKVDQKGRYNYCWIEPQMVYGRENGTGYIKMTITEYGKTIDQYAHILVAMTFIPNPYNLPEINHLNTIRNDNSVPNLERCTHKQNMEHASKMGRMKGRRKTRAVI